MESNTLHILYSGLGGTTNYVSNWLSAEKSEGGNVSDCLFYGIEPLKNKTKDRFTELARNVMFIPKSGKIGIRSLPVIKKIVKNYSNIILHVDSLILPIHFFRNNSARLIFVEHQANCLKDKIRWKWSKIAQEKADFVVSLTKNQQATLKNTLRNYSDQKNIVINTGIDIEKYRLSSRREKMLFGAIGRLNNLRDFESLVLAFNQLDKSYRLLIAGDGENKRKLEKLSNSNIEFLGELNEEEMIDFLNRISVFLKPSFGESNSIAIMEGQAAGLPIIGWDVEGINNVLNDQNSILVKPKDVSQIRAVVEELAGNTNESLKKLDSLSKASTKFAEANLSHIAMYEAYKKIMI